MCSEGDKFQNENPAVLPKGPSFPEGVWRVTRNAYSSFSDIAYRRAQIAQF
jgi:hypothetical protein